MTLKNHQGLKKKIVSNTEAPKLETKAENTEIDFNNILNNRNLKDSLEQAGRLKKNVTVTNMQVIGKENVKPILGFNNEVGLQEYSILDGKHLIPNYKQTYKAGFFKSAGALEFYNCNGYKNGKRYTGLKIIKPAIVEVSGNAIVVKEKGELEFSGEEEDN